jgi:RHS repeat-associated protein
MVQGSDTITVNPISVTPTITIQEASDTTYTQSFSVHNLGTVADTVTLAASCSPGFTCSLLSSTPMPLAAHGVGTANVNVTTSGQGTSGTVTLGATPTHGVGGGSAIVTVNVPVPLPPTVAMLPHNGYNHSTALCALNCFNVTAGYATPSYVSLDVSRSVTLVYSSAMAYPLGVVAANAKDSSFRLAQQLSISATRGGVHETFTNGTTELYFSQTATDTSTKRLAGQISAVLSTGIYYDTTTIKSRWTSGPYSGTVTQTSVPTTLLIDNEQSSPFGSGWGIAGLQHLVVASDSLSIAVTDGTGSMQLFARPNKTSPWVSSPGDFTTFTTLTSGGTITGYQRRTPDGIVFAFSPTGFLRSAKNRFNDSTSYHYNASNLLTAIVDPIGDSITLTYTSNKLSTLTDPGGRVTHVTVDASGNLVTIKDPTGTSTFGGTYDSHHRLTQMTDRAGNTWLYRYDFASTIASDSTPAVVADGVTKRLGTHFRSTLAAELIDTATHTGSSAAPAPPVRSDSVWAIEVRPAVDSVRMAVDAFGDPTLVEDLQAQITSTITRNTASQPTKTVTTVHGRTVENSTDVWNGVDETKTTNALTGAVVTFQFDSTYHLLTAIGGSTVADTFFLEAGGKVAELEKSGGVFTSFSYDSHGRLQKVTDPALHVDSVIFSTGGYRNTATSVLQNRITSFGYDHYGRIDTVRTGSSVSVSQEDSLGRRHRTILPNGVSVTFAYDSLSNVRSITDAMGQTYQYSYNSLGWLVAQIDADTNHTLSARTDSFFYSAAGLPTKHRDRNGAVTSFTYDPEGRPLTRTLADGRVTRYGYDPTGLFETDSSAESIDSVSLDSAGLRQSEFTKQLGRTYTLVSTADTNALVRALAVRQGTTLLDSVSYGYDGTFRLDTLRTGASKSRFRYAADGLLQSWILPTGDSISMLYSGTHQALSETHSSIAAKVLNESVQRDTLDRVIQETMARLADTVRYFAYDSTNRLLSYLDSASVDSLICVPDPNGQDGQHCSMAGGGVQTADETYTYDSANNRRDMGAVLTAEDRLTRFNGYTLTYDNDGNITHKSKAGFDQYYYWNSIGELDSAITNGVAVRFGYDGQGRRIRKSTSTRSLRYIYDGLVLIAEVDSATGIAQKIYRYYPGVDDPHSVKELTGTYYYLSGIASPGVFGLADSTGALRNRYRYAPWGQLEDSLEGVPNALKFAGREYDAETNLYYNRARYYDPQLARFISQDPLGQVAGVNEYAYSGDNPLGNTDPTGLDCTSGYLQLTWTYPNPRGIVVQAYDFILCDDDEGLGVADNGAPGAFGNTVTGGGGGGGRVASPPKRPGFFRRVGRWLDSDCGAESAKLAGTVLGDASWFVGAGELIEGAKLAKASFEAGSIAYFTSEAWLGSKMLAPMSRQFSLAAGAAAGGAEAKLTMYSTQTSLDNLAANPGSNPPESWMDLVPFLDLGPALNRFANACL